MKSQRVLIGGVIVAMVTIAACGDDEPDTAAAGTAVDTASLDSEPAGAPTADEQGWSFTDDTGTTITLDEAPDVIVSSSVVAGTLWEYGVDVDAVYGPLHGGNGEPDPQLGLADPDQFDSLGQVWGEINLEQLAATQPDVIIDAMWGGEESLTSHPQWEQLQQIAPNIHIEVVDTSFAAIPERFAELAVALGGDETRVDEARAEFERASQRLGDVAAAREAIDAAFVTASNELLYLGVIEGFTDLQYFDDLGLDILQQPPTEDLTIGGVVYWTELSWEHADRASADVIFVDTRTYSDVSAILDEHPTWQALPARQAEQVGGWDVEPGYGYRNLARLLGDMAATLEQADDLVG
jgi:iron complex transport system substrate-binding protein